MVRRRDLLKAAGEGRRDVRVRELMGKPHIVPENATLSDALHDLVRAHQHLAVVVDEFGAFAGVLYPLRDVLHPTGEQRPAPSPSCGAAAVTPSFTR